MPIGGYGPTRTILIRVHGAGKTSSTFTPRAKAPRLMGPNTTHGEEIQLGAVPELRTSRLHVDRVDDRNLDHLDPRLHRGAHVPTIGDPRQGSCPAPGSEDNARPDR